MNPAGELLLPSGRRHIHFADIDSTNSEGLRLVGNGEAGPVWISADIQSHGRGRRSRDWVSLTGNLHASFLFEPDCAPSKAAQIGFVAGLACHDAAKRQTGAGVERLSLKWPNDLLLDGQKVAGILLEQSGETANTCLVIGFGVNIKTHPVDTAYPAGNFGTKFKGVTVAGFLADLDRALEHWLGIWSRGSGFDTIRAHWAQRAHGIESDIKIDLGDRIVKGRFTGLDHTGAMILRQNDGQEHIIVAGDFIGPG